jgi:hypothetical protein
MSVLAVGEVFHVQKLQEFEGTYKVNQPEVTMGRGPNDVSLVNEHGAVVVLSVKVPATTTDVTLTPSPRGVTVKLAH